MASLVKQQPLALRMVILVVTIQRSEGKMALRKELVLKVMNIYWYYAMLLVHYSFEYYSRWLS